MNNLLYLILTNVPDCSLKIICTDSTEILFSKLRSAGLNYHLPNISFSLFLTVRGGGGGGGGI